LSEAEREARGGGWIRVAAAAKINLYLHVLGRREDGYHRLDSLIVFTDVRDILEVGPGSGLSLEVSGPAARALTDEKDDNLVLRAARKLAAAAGIKAGARLRLEKRIPVAAGLGGGSADAAAALRALAALWDLPEALCAATPGSPLTKLALELGADVPVCLAAVPARIGGIGEVVEPAPSLPAIDIVLVNPGVPLSTQSVFRSNRKMGPPAERFTHPPADVEELADWLRPLRNDLSEAAMQIAPVLRQVIAALEKTDDCRLARMSGSGASCFGLYPNAQAAARAAATIHRARPDWWVQTARTLPSAL
jgi:4-diphosphocytidyl-2-C-methyl-D-erythritol kinase